MRNVSKMTYLLATALTMAPFSLEAKKLAPPIDVRAEKDSKLDGAVDLRWRAVKGATSYTISASRENDENWQDVGVTTGTVFQVTDLPEETLYYFRIASHSTDGQSLWSQQVMQISSGKKPSRF